VHHLLGNIVSPFHDQLPGDLQLSWQYSPTTTTETVVNALTIVTVDLINEITVIAGPILTMTIGIDVIIAAMTGATTTVVMTPTTGVTTTEVIVVMIATTTNATTDEMTDVMINSPFLCFHITLLQ
jgi:hypothetical protein